MTENQSPWPLRAVALLIAVLTWLFASYMPRVEELGESMVEIDLDQVSLNYAAPPGNYMYLRSNRPTTIQVRVEGRSQIVNSLSNDSINVTVPLPAEIEPGVATEIALSATDASAPEGVRILSFSPASVSVQIDQVVEQDVTVNPELVGEPGAGLTREDVRWTVRPSTVTVRGPRSLLSNLSALPTVPVDLNARSLSFEGQYAVVVPDASITVEPAVVTVSVVLEPPADTPPSSEVPAAPSNGIDGLR